jgi:hypothetical protein
MADLFWLFPGAALFTATAPWAHGCGVLRQGKVQ